MKLKFLFIVPPYHHYCNTVPYGTAIVATVAKKAGFDVRMFNAQKGEDMIPFQKRLNEYIKNNGIDVAALGAMSIFFVQSKELLQTAKSAGCITVLGGAICDPNPELIAENINADYLIIGEGEETFCELARYLEDGFCERSEIHGLCYKDKNGKIIKTNPRNYIKNLDVLPFVDEEFAKYNESVLRRNSLMITASRSCPFQCTFCYHLKGFPYRQRSLDNIFAELDYYVGKYGFSLKYLSIMDDLFNYDKARVLEFCKRIKPYGLLVAVQLRLDKIDEETIYAMFDSGVRLIAFGLESASNRVLKSMKKNLSIELIRERLDLIIQAGIMPIASLIMGDIEDDLDSIAENIAFFEEYSHKMMLFTIPINIYVGTELFKMAWQKGFIKSELDFLEAYPDDGALMNVSKLSQTDYDFMIQICKTKLFNLMRQKQLCDYNRKLHIHQDASFDYSARCVHCLKEVSFYNMTREDMASLPFAEYAAPYFLCPHCNGICTMDNSFYFSYEKHYKRGYYICYDGSYANELIHLMGGGTRIAVWGVNNAFRVLLFDSPVLRERLCAVADGQFEDFKNETYCGLSVISPGSLCEKDFDMILVSDHREISKIKNCLADLSLNMPVMALNL